MPRIGESLTRSMLPGSTPDSPEGPDAGTPPAEPVRTLREELLGTRNELSRPATWESTIRFLPSQPFAAKPVEAQARSREAEVQQIVSGFPSVKLTITEERLNHALEVRFSLSGPVDDTREASARLQDLFGSRSPSPVRR